MYLATGPGNSSRKKLVYSEPGHSKFWLEYALSFHVCGHVDGDQKTDLLSMALGWSEIIWLL